MIRTGLLCFPKRTNTSSSSCRPLLRISQRHFTTTTTTSPRSAFLRPSQWFQQEALPSTKVSTSGSITPEYTFMKRVGKPKILRQIIVSPNKNNLFMFYFLFLTFCFFPVRHDCLYVCFCISCNRNTYRDGVLERKNDNPFAYLGSQNHYQHRLEARSECGVDSGVYL